jgi:hypothetical protein
LGHNHANIYVKCPFQILNATQELDSGTWTCSLTQSASDLNHEAQVQVQVFTRPIIKMTLLQNLKKPESSAKTLENGGDSQKEYWKVTDKVSLIKIRVVFFPFFLTIFNFGGQLYKSSSSQPGSRCLIHKANLRF